jgi:hypothetical protein
MPFACPSAASITRSVLVLRDKARPLLAGVLAALLGIGIGAAAADQEVAGKRAPDRWEGTVLARSLNVRAGPGEGYPIVTTLKRGDAIVAVDEQSRWVRLEGIGEGDVEAWAYRRFLSLPDDFMAPALGDAENDFIDWAAARGDLEEFSIDGVQRLSVVLAVPSDAAGAAAIAREIGCAWRERMQLEEKVTVTVWPDSGPLGGWIAQATCP